MAPEVLRKDYTEVAAWLARWTLVLPRPGTVPEANQPVIPIIKYYVQYRITIMIVGEQARFSDSF